MTTFSIIILLIISYLLGSIPNGLILTKVFKNVDLRNEGSKNIGATNTMRVLGLKFGVFALFLDALKGVVVIIILRLLGAVDLYNITLFNQNFNILAAYGLAAVLGHIFPIYLNFKGGKAVATSYGIAFVLLPTTGILATISFVLIVYFTKYVSLGSLLSALLVFILTIFGVVFEDFGKFLTLGEKPPFEYILFLTIIGYIIFARHKPNIDRLSQGVENKVEL